ncbi:MAG: DUF1284 domain-containing protein [Clostridiales bacterium]|nr:DUF1284 domain-containing protein [Clostridiales bacterium]
MEKPVKEYEIRAHHGMCLAFFEGKGYSDGFVKYMAEIKEALGKDPVVRLVNRTDEICGYCPHNKLGCCDSEEKVGRYDALVFCLCGVEEGIEIRWSIFERLVEQNIISAGKREEVCGDCQWNSICRKPLDA